MKFTVLLSLGLIPFAVAQSTSLGPAPTESYGCEPHGDHYHCESHVSETAAAHVPTSVSTPAPTATEEESHDHEEHDDHDHETGSLPPSPTASAGCEPHGDHWHCDGPATPTGESGETTPTGGVAAQLIPIAGALAAVGFAL
ncbi:hypothetical protein ACO1O0_007048 [Amphichorda felina]